MTTMTPERIKILRVKLKIAQAEKTIRLRAKNAADRGLLKVERIITKLEGRLNENPQVMAQS